MSLVRSISELSARDVAIAGGKGASLGELVRSGFPVPPGFVVLSSAFDAAVKAVGLGRDATPKQWREAVLAATIPRELQDEIISNFRALGASFVAVRSSATAEDSAQASWAGQFETYLNTTEQNLMENIKRCWASAYSARAVAYQRSKGGGACVSVAVVVQKMIESESSGIAFSMHPVSQDRNQVVIEAGFGLGEAIVAGHITPDQYVVEKDSRRILESHIQTQPKGLYRTADGGQTWRDLPSELGSRPTLTEDQVLELADLVARIEAHYSFPCDIEWALENSKLFILQSRPITTL